VMMRFRTFALIITISVLMISCQKEDILVQNNSFTYDGHEYNLSDGMVVRNGNSNKPHQLDFIVYSGFNVYRSGNQVDSIIGTGNAIEFPVIYSPSATELTPGTYTFDQLAKSAYTFSAGYLALNYCNDKASGKVSFFTAGKLEVVKNGDFFEFSFDLTDEANKRVQGFYRGPANLVQMQLKSIKSASLNNGRAKGFLN